MMMLLFFLVGNPAFAAGTGSNSAQQRLKNLLKTTYFEQGLTFVLGGWALVKWFDYFNNFTFENAMPGALKPAALTFLAFNWLDFAHWVGLI